MCINIVSCTLSNNQALHLVTGTCGFLDTPFLQQKCFGGGKM